MYDHCFTHLMTYILGISKNIYIYILQNRNEQRTNAGKAREPSFEKVSRTLVQLKNPKSYITKIHTVFVFRI